MNLRLAGGGDFGSICVITIECIKHRQVIAPHFVARAVYELRKADKRYILRLARRSAKNETDLCKGLIALAGIAFLAAADKVIPRRRAAHSFGYNVVHGKVISPVAAILAGVVIAREYAAPGQLQLWFRTLDMILQSHHRRRGVTRRNGVKYLRVAVQHVHFAKKDERHRPPHIADVQRFIIAVEYQYFLSHIAQGLQINKNPP